MRIAFSQRLRGLIAHDTSKESASFASLDGTESFAQSPKGIYRELKLLACLLCFLSSAAAQSIAITAPAAGAVIGGFDYTLTCSVTSIGTLAYVEYRVDGETVGYARASELHTCPSLPWNTYYAGNGSAHTFQAQALDATYSTLAASATVSAAVENWLPQQTCLYSDTPSNACTDIAVTAQPAASITLTTDGIQGMDWTANAISVKPSGGSPPAVGGTVVVTNINQTTVTTPGMTVASGDWVLVAILGMTTSGSGADALSALVDQEGTNILASTSTTGCTANAHRQFNNSRWCWVKPAMVHGSANYTVTATWSSAQDQGQTVRLYKVAGAAATNAIDAQVNDAGGATGNPNVKLQLVTDGIPMAVANESVFAFFTHRQTSGGAMATTAGSNYTSAEDSNSYTTSEYTTMTGANWFGQEALTVVVHGSNAAVQKDFMTYVDGDAAQPGPGITYAASGVTYSCCTANSTETTLKFWVDTARWTNQSHQVAISATNTLSTNCPGGSSAGCVNGAWNLMGNWEQAVTFANTVLPVELRASARDQKAVCPSFPCAALPALTGTVSNTDGTTQAASIASCVSSDSTVVTVTSPACLPTPQAYGSAYVTMTDSNGFTRQSWIYVVAANNYPHIGNDASVLTSYTAGKSLIIRSMFSSGPLFATLANNGEGLFVGYGVAQAASDWQAGGFNAAEGFFPAPPGDGAPSTEAAWESDVRSRITTACSVLTNGVHPYFVSDSWIGSSGLLYGSRAYGGTFTTPPLQYFYSQWAALCPNNLWLGNTVSDEVTGLLTTSGAIPCGLTDAGCTIGSGAITSVACVAGANCTVTCVDNGCPTTQGLFIVTGSGVPALDTRATVAPSGNPAVYHATGPGPVFATPAGIGTITFSASSNNCGAGGTSSCANLKIEPFAYFVQDASPWTGTPSTDWIHSNVLLNYHTWAKAGSSKALLTYAPAAPAASAAMENGWCGAASVADTCDHYWSDFAAYLPSRGSLRSLITALGNGWRRNYGAVYSTKPTSLIAEGIQANFSFTGYPASVVSCTGSTIAFSAPHHLSKVFNGIGRLWVTGSTGCNGRYYVISSPSATTLSVAQSAQFTASPSGTLTFTGGGTFSATFAPQSVVIGPSLMVVTGCSSTLKNHRGQTFTTSTGNSSMDNAVWLYAIETPDPCLSTGEEIYQVPNLTSTGGTAYIIPDNNMIRGRNWELNSENGHQAGMVTSTYCIILGCSGSRQYAAALNYQAYDRTSTAGYSNGLSGQAAGMRQAFNDGQICFQSCTPPLGGVQSGGHPHWDVANSKIMYWCTAIGNLVTQRLTKWEVQPSLPSPDYGMWYEAAARQDASGNNLLMIQQFADATTSLAANLTPYLIGGQAIIKYVASCDDGIVVSTLAAGTTSDTTAVCKAGCFVAYVFDHNAAGILSQPAIGARLADTAGATKIQVRYSYSPYAFDQQSDVLPQVYDCGTGACTLPVDRNIGPIYYQIQYLDMNGSVLATGDTGQL